MTAGNATNLPDFGLHPETSEGDYRLWPAANYSALKEFRFTPAHVYQYLTDPPASTPAMELGTAMHVAILQPWKFSERYVCGPRGDGRSAAYKRELEELKTVHEGKQIVRHADWLKIVAMRDAAWRHGRVKELLSGDGYNECSFLWEDPDTGLACKGRVDRIGMSREGWPCVIDYKTFGERGGKLTPHAIESVIFDRQYHIQAAHYLNGLQVIAPFQRRYILFLQEKEPPHLPRTVEIDFAALELGRRQVARWLRELKRCQDANEWPGWSDDFDPMGVPTWAYREEEEANEENLPG